MGTQQPPLSAESSPRGRGNNPRDRRLRLNLSNQEADELFFFLSRIIDALWDAYDDVFMEPYFQEQEVQANEERLAAFLHHQEQEREDDAYFARHVPF